MSVLVWLRDKIFGKPPVKEEAPVAAPAPVVDTQVTDAVTTKPKRKYTKKKKV